MSPFTTYLVTPSLFWKRNFVTLSPFFQLLHQRTFNFLHPKAKISRFQKPQIPTFPIAIPKPSSKLKAKLGMALLSVLVHRLLRTYLNQVHSSQARGFQAWPGAFKADQGHLETLNLKCWSQTKPRPYALGPWPWPCPKPLKLYSKLKPGNGTALSDFCYLLLKYKY